MPAVDRSRLDQHQRVPQPSPHASQDQTEQTVSWAKPPIRPREDAELVAQSEALEQQLSTLRYGGADRSDRPNDVTHRA
jgi:hypothetical protein